jgi:hypothetical protein
MTYRIGKREPPLQLFLNLINPVNHVHSLLPYLQRRIAEQDPCAAHVRSLVAVFA